MAKQSEATLLLRIKTAGEEALSKTGDALKKLAQVATAAYATANAAAAAALHAYREQEQATNALNQALINQGIYSKGLSNSYQQMASELQKLTTFGDEAIIAAQAQIQQYIGQTKITKDLTKATLDFATAMGMDLSSAANAIGKSIGSNTNMLARYGISVDENASKSEKLAQVTEQLQRRFGGQAEAAAQGLGSLTTMSNAMGEILEVAGERLAPFVIYASKVITDFSYELQNNQVLLNNFESTAIILGKTGITLKNIIAGLGETIGQVFGTIVGSIMQVANAQFKMAYETIKSGFSGTAESIVNRYDTFQKELSIIDNIYTSQKKNEDEQELRRLQQTAEAKKNIDRNLVLTQEQIFAARDQRAIQRDIDNQSIREELERQSFNRRMYGEGSYTQRLNAELEKRKFLDDKYDEIERKRIFELNNFKDNMNSKAMHEFESVLSNMASMQQSKNKILVAIGKAAAIAQMTISGAKATVQAFDFVNSIAGPIAAGVAAAPIAGWTGIQIASIAGIELAEGGLVKATPGGVPAIIGEGGRDELVIPLEKGSSPSDMGTKINLQVYGGFLGDETQAKEFAIVLDKELMKLRRSNESLAFDEGII